METDVLVIGGGATGAGLGWDLAQRGVRVVVAEMGDLATGTSGRYHGLLHSGGRYAVKDPESAKECIDENLILRRIVPHAIEDTGGYFVLCPGDDTAYIDTWLTACAAVGIPTEAVPLATALRREPALNPGIGAVYAVPDGSCDSWDLAHTLQHAAQQVGGRFLTYHRVDSFHKQGDRIVGARMTNLRNNETVDITCALVINATGPWAAQVAALAGAHINMHLSRGAMLAFNLRWVNTVINRLRPPGDGDIFVPVGTVSVTGTTAVPTDDPGDTRVERWEVERILELTEAMTPGISRARVLRSWGGVRPLYDPHGSDDERDVLRTFSVLNHGTLDGVEGMLSIAGGKLTTYRLMAEKVADAACAILGVDVPCATATTVLLGPEGERKLHHLGNRLDRLEHGETPGPLICECEMVTAPQIRAALAEGNVVTLNDLRRDLRLGMGPCQGGFCAFRAASIVHEVRAEPVEHTQALLTEFVERRFGGMKPLLWGHNLRQALLAEQIYGRIVGITPSQPVQAPPPIPPVPLAKKASGGARVVVVGAGLAGLMAALTAAEAGARVELAAFGQGTLTLHPGWLEVGEVAALAAQPDHPYAHSQDALADGLSLLNRVVPLTSVPHALTASGRLRPVAYAAGGALHTLTPGSKIAVVGIDQWRDFYSGLIADNLRDAGYEATSFDIRLHERIGNFDAWPVDMANLLDTPDGLTMLLKQVRPRIGSASVVAFPAVLGFKPETRQRIADALGCAVIEVPTLPPSVPGLRLFNALKAALMDFGVRVTFGARVSHLVRDGSRVTGVQIETANGRPRTLYGDAVILATGGVYGGGIESDFRLRLWEPLAGLDVAHVPAGDWFTHPLTSGERQPIHAVGVRTDAQLRPLTADSGPLAANLYAAGRLLGGTSPIVEGSSEGIDIATGTKAAQMALLSIGVEMQI
jgi:glycerol-3-phosphate dehydrogenase